MTVRSLCTRRRSPENRAALIFAVSLARMYLFLGQYKKGIEVISPVPLSQAGTFGMLLYAETGQMAKAVEIARAESGQIPYGVRSIHSRLCVGCRGRPCGSEGDVDQRST